jgi:hypothetical protein
MDAAIAAMIGAAIDMVDSVGGVWWRNVIRRSAIG